MVEKAQAGVKEQGAVPFPLPYGFWDHVDLFLLATLGNGL